MNSERDELLKQEEVCLQAISAFLKDGIDGCIQYVQTAKAIAAQEKQRKHNGILESYAEFWRICFSDFNEYILHIDDEVVPCQTIEIDISDEQYEQEKSAYERVTWESALD